MSTSVPKVAVVGFPNVGKSTLVNRLTGTRQAVVHDQPGVTRDRKEIETEWNGVPFALIDTGGVDLTEENELARQVQQQARVAIEEAQVVMLVVDAKAGVGPGDQEIAELVRNSHKPAVAVANKVESKRDLATVGELYGLGLGEPSEVSAAHGTGSGDLLDRLAQLCGEVEPQEISDTVRVAFIGRPNVGKSSLVNTILDQDRVVVSDMAGTTRDAIDTRVEIYDRDVTIVDTAGLRRRTKVAGSVEYYAQLRSEEAAQRADVALVVCDASEGVTSEDIKIAELAMKSNCATIFILNKWDITETDLKEAEEWVGTKTRLHPQLLTASALTGRGIARLLKAALELYDRSTTRIGTSELNQVIAEIQQRKQAPTVRGKRFKIYYMAQISDRPPRFSAQVNSVGYIKKSYAYYIENRLREHFGLRGVPLVIDYKGKKKRRIKV